MQIDKNTVYKVADLARIHIEENEVEGMTQELNKILQFMDKLNELDTESVQPLVYMNDTHNVWREDVAKQELSVEEGLKNSALHNESYFLVPKIIEK